MRDRGLRRSVKRQCLWNQAWAACGRAVCEREGKRDGGRGRWQGGEERESAREREREGGRERGRGGAGVGLGSEEKIVNGYASK